MRFTDHPIGINQSIRASIEIPNLQLSYTPGDLIRGIVKKVHIDVNAETVSVVIKFIARAETKISKESTTDGKSSTSTYRGEKTLFSFRQQLYHGSASSGINTWPFSFTVPEKPFDGPVAMLELLPPTFYRPREAISLAHRDYLYVEYRLEAEIYQASASRAVATFPIYVRPKSTMSLITDFAPCLSSFHNSVKTLRLDPEYAGKDLTLRQHMRSVFQRSTLPQYSYCLTVQHPSVIQLEHTEPLSFKLHALSNAHPTQTTSFLIEKPPVLTLVSVVIRLRSATHVDALDGNSIYVTSRREGRWQDTYLVEWEKGMDGVPIPNENQQNDTLDIAKDLQLRLSSRGVSISKPGHVRHASFENPIVPSFRTRHISHIHELKWKLVVACAGKEQKIVGAAPVTVLGPSEHTEQRKELCVGAGGIARAHSDWASGVVDTPMLGESVVGVAYRDQVNTVVNSPMPVAVTIEPRPAYSGPKV